jgi:hypothetical protein
VSPARRSVKRRAENPDRCPMESETAPDQQRSTPLSLVLAQDPGHKS